MNARQARGEVVSYRREPYMGAADDLLSLAELHAKGILTTEAYLQASRSVVGGPTQSLHAPQKPSRPIIPLPPARPHFEKPHFERPHFERPQRSEPPERFSRPERFDRPEPSFFDMAVDSEPEVTPLEYRTPRVARPIAPASRLHTRQPEPSHINRPQHITRPEPIHQAPAPVHQAPTPLRQPPARPAAPTLVAAGMTPPPTPLSKKPAKQMVAAASNLPQQPRKKMSIMGRIGFTFTALLLPTVALWHILTRNDHPREWYRRWWGKPIAILFAPLFGLWHIWSRKPHWGTFKRATVTLGLLIFGTGYFAIPFAAHAAIQKEMQASEYSETATPAAESKTITENKVIAFDTQTVDDPTLAAGSEVVKQEGANGAAEVSYQVTMKGDTEINRQVIKEDVTTAPTPKIVAHGTKTAATPVAKKTTTAKKATTTKKTTR